MLGGYYLGQLYLGMSGLPSAGVLSVVQSNHQLSSDNITLVQKHTIVIESAAHSLTSENITLTQKHVLAVEDAVHSQLSDNSSITSEHFLGLDDSFHGLTSTEIQLLQKHTIIVENTTHGSTSENLGLTEHKTLAVDNTLHGHTAQAVILVVKSYLDVANGLHTHTADGVTLTQKHTLVVSNTTHSLLIDSLGGLINLEPFGFGGGFGAIEAWGVKQFGVINIELPINFLILAQDGFHNLTSEEIAEFIQIFNMVKRGEYTKDFESEGAVGSEYSQDAGTMPVNNGSFGQITPVTDEDNGFFVVDMGASGSYTQHAKTSGVITTDNGSGGMYSPDDIDTGNYIKIK